jgi:hypothetical protein
MCLVKLTVPSTLHLISSMFHFTPHYMLPSSEIPHVPHQTHYVGKLAQPSQQVFELYYNSVTMHKAGLDSITIQIEICIEIIEIHIEIIISNCDEP